MTQVVALVLLMAGVRCAVVPAELHIKECSHAGWVEIREDSKAPSSVTCEGIPGNSGVTWTLTANKTVKAYLCDLGIQPCSYTDIFITVTSEGSKDSSVLTITRNHRVLAGNGTVRCQEQALVEGIQCSTNLVHPATVHSCHDNFNYDVQNWTLSGSGCRFEGAYSSNGTYTSTWYRQREGSSSRKYLTTVNLTTTEHIINREVYYNGTYSLPTTPLPTEQGVYHYSVHFLPGPDIQNMTTINIEPPSDSTNLSTTCPRHVYEGERLQCECKATVLSGNPPPAVQWRGSGPDEDLVIQAVSRNDSGQRFSCELIWGPPPNQTYRSVSYTLDVAYGPESVNVTDPQTSDEDTVSLTCVVTNVHPSADFNWTGVTCQAITVSTYISVCGFSPAHMEDGDLVTCTAWNSAFPDAVIQNATYNFTLKDFQSPEEHEGDQKGSDAGTGKAGTGSDAGFPLEAVIGGLVAGLVVVIVIIIIIVVLVKRRRHRKLNSTARESAKVIETTDSDEFEEHINPIYGIEEDKDGLGKPRAVALRIPASPEDTDDPITTAPGYMNVHQHRADHGLGDSSGQHEANGSQPPGTLSVPSASNPPPISAAKPVSAAVKTSPEMDGLYTSVGESEADISGRHEEADGLDDYAVVDPQSPEAAQPDPAVAGEDAGGYAVADFPASEPPWTDSSGMKEGAGDYVDLATSHTPPDVPQEYIYAVVDKSKSTGGQPGPEAILDPSWTGRLRGAYAQVQKPKSAAKSPPEPKAKPLVHPKPVVKSKPGRRVGGETTRGQSGTETEGYIYAQVQKPKPAGGPKPDSTAKPPIQPKPSLQLAAEGNQSKSRQTDGDYEEVTPFGEEVTQIAPPDDEYNTLNFYPGATLPTGDDPDHSLYSHIV